MKTISLFMKNRFKLRAVMLLLVMWLLPSLASAAEPINVAGVYECDTKIDGVRKQMYLTLDFVNGNVPDFTQVFTTKESSFSRLPKDFMNAKKLSRSFSGTNAPGFGRFKEKFLFSGTEEFRLTNPRLDGGIIIADWTNADGDTGECRIAVKDDRSLRIIGLTKMAKDFNPDNIELTLAEDRLPRGTVPFVTPKDDIDFLLAEYEKSLVTPKVTSFDPDIKTEVVKAIQKDNQIAVYLKIKNNSNYDVLNIVVADQRESNTFAESKDGKVMRSFRPVTPGTVGDKPAVQAKKGEWVEFAIVFDEVNGTVDYLSTLKFDNYLAGGFFMDNHITAIENIPVFQYRSKPKANQVNKSAQLNFEVELPSWTAVASTVSGKSINIRKSPSSSAPRPLVNQSEIDNFQVPLKYYARWSTAVPKGDITVLMFEPDQYAPVLKEQNGWYELAGIGARSDNGWVSAQYCKKYNLEPITETDLKNSGYIIFSNESGIYPVSVYYDEMDNYVELNIGKLVDGTVVIPYSLIMDVTTGNDTKIIKNNDGYIIQVSRNICDEFGIPDVSKLPRDIITEAISAKKPLESPSYICKINGTLQSIM